MTTCVWCGAPPDRPCRPEGRAHLVRQVDQMSNLDEASFKDLIVDLASGESARMASLVYGAELPLVAKLRSQIIRLKQAPSWSILPAGQIMAWIGEANEERDQR